MRLLCLLFLLLALAFGATPTLSFLSEEADTDATEDAGRGELLCGDEETGCWSDYLQDGECNQECQNSECGFIDVVDCAAEYGN
jgi:hypothetical protein